MIILTVWAVEEYEGSSNSYVIIRLFSTKAKADDFLSKCKYPDEFRVREWELE